MLEIRVLLTGLFLEGYKDVNHESIKKLDKIS